MASNRRPAGQSDGLSNLSAIVAADRAFQALLGICDRTIKTHWTPRRRVYRLNKPYPTKVHTFGELLRKKRLDSSFTQPQLALKLGVPQSSIDKWESDKTTPPRRYRAAITDFLGFVPFSLTHDPTVQ